MAGRQIYQPIYFPGECAGLFVDQYDDLYCSLFDASQVVKTPLNYDKNKFVIVAGTGYYGSGLDMLNKPMGIFVTADLNLYVADCGNSRIQLFPTGSIIGTPVVGAGARTTITLNCPSAIILDADGHLFITDSGGHRIVGSDNNGFRCLVGCSGSPGSASDELFNPGVLAFASNGDLFVADNGNGRIQQFQLISNLCGKSMIFVLMIKDSATRSAFQTSIKPICSTLVLFR